METSYSASYRVDGVSMPIAIDHPRPKVRIFAIILVSMALALPILFTGKSLVWATLPFLIGPALSLCLKVTYPAWRKKLLSNEDIDKVRLAFVKTERHQIKLAPLPGCASSMTNGDLEDWAAVANRQLQMHYRELLSSECPVSNTAFMDWKEKTSGFY